MKEKAWFW